MHNTNIHVILHLMAVNELNIAYRSCSMNELPTSQSYLRWTVEEEAAKMAHIFDNLSTVLFKSHKKGVFTQEANRVTAQAVSRAYSFYAKYHGLNDWDRNVYFLFTQLLYLRAVKLAEIATGIRMDYNWMNTTLRRYGEHSSALYLDWESQELKDRISRGEFDPTEEEKAIMSEVMPDLEKSLNEYLTHMYGFVNCVAHSFWYY